MVFETKRWYDRYGSNICAEINILQHITHNRRQTSNQLKAEEIGCKKKDLLEDEIS